MKRKKNISPTNTIQRSCIFLLLLLLLLSSSKRRKLLKARSQRDLIPLIGVREILIAPQNPLENQIQEEISGTSRDPNLDPLEKSKGWLVHAAVSESDNGVIGPLSSLVLRIELILFNPFCSLTQHLCCVHRVPDPRHLN